MSLLSTIAGIMTLIHYFPVPLMNPYIVASTLSSLPLFLILALLRYSLLSKQFNWLFPGNSFYAFILNKFYFLQQFSRSVEINEVDELYHEVTGWLARHIKIEEEPFLEARARGFSIKAIEYLPPPSTTTILHYRGTYYAIQFGQVNVPELRQPTKRILIRTAGWNVDKIDQLLREVRNSTSNHGMISIYRSTQDRHTESFIWASSLSRSTRSLASIALDPEIKRELTEDLDDYLNPKTLTWYLERGIPYRRGYLLEGPPETGKSSMSFIIASYTKLPLFNLVLTPKMNDDYLRGLFRNLPKRCIVLIEDVDVIGLRLADKDKSSKQGGVSLAGLLNVLDGVDAQEGRIVVMTTNHSNSLDDALKRPGRIDRALHFSNLNHNTARELFYIIYMKMPRETPGLVGGGMYAATESCLPGWKASDIEILANIFSQNFDKLGGQAPCEIKNYLERYRSNPAGAVANLLKGPSSSQIDNDTSLATLGTSKSIVAIDKLPYTTHINLFIHSPVGYLLFRSSSASDSHDSWEPHRGKILLQDATLGHAVRREIFSLIGLDCTKIHQYQVVADSPDPEQLYSLNFYVLGHVSQAADPKAECLTFKWMVAEEFQADIDGQALNVLRGLHDKSECRHGS
ncbi:hypothetical protein BDW69DRAFT_101239 [Aspergillus filifer]